MVKNQEINVTEEIGLVTPTPQGLNPAAQWHQRVWVSKSDI